MNFTGINYWKPNGEGTDFELSPILTPLAAVPRSDGRRQRARRSTRPTRLDDGANGDHTRGTSSWLTGVHPKHTEGADVRNGISADQIAAHVLGKDTPLPSLELAHRPELPGRQLRERLQLRLHEHAGVALADDAAADREQPARGLRAAVRRRRHVGAAARAGAREPQHPRLGDRRRWRRLQSTLGPGDRTTVDDYLDAVREVERRIQSVEKHGATDRAADARTADRAFRSGSTSTSS